jgi:hypothetical protein
LPTQGHHHPRIPHPTLFGAGPDVARRLYELSREVIEFPVLSIVTSLITSAGSAANNG